LRALRRKCRGGVPLPANFAPVSSFRTPNAPRPPRRCHPIGSTGTPACAHYRCRRIGPVAFGWIDASVPLFGQLVRRERTGRSACATKSYARVCRARRRVYHSPQPKTHPFVLRRHP
jgi:hypothetical protein